MCLKCRAMLFFMILSLFMSCNALEICRTCNTTGPQTESIIIAEFTNWKYWTLGSLISNLNASLYTHILYNSINPTGAKCSLTDTVLETQMSFSSSTLGSDFSDPYKGLFNQIRRLKLVYPHLKAIMGIGGYDYSSDLSTTAGNKTLRAQLVSSCLTMMVQYGFDGINLDWQYPTGGGKPNNIASSSDRANLVSLSAAFRSAMAPGKYSFSLSIAYATSELSTRYNLVSLASYVDWIHVRALWFWGGWNSVIGHSANLYTPGNSSPHTRSVAYQMTQALSLGISPCKLVLEIPSYGFQWSLASRPSSPSFPSFYTTGTSTAQFSGSDGGLYIDQDLASMTTANGWVDVWDSTANASVLYKDSSQLLVTYDSKSAAIAKAKWVVSNGIAGVALQDVNGDMIANRLGTTLLQTLQSQRPCASSLNSISSKPSSASSFNSVSSKPSSASSFNSVSSKPSSVKTAVPSTLKKSITKALTTTFSTKLTKAQKKTTSHLSTNKLKTSTKRSSTSIPRKPTGTPTTKKLSLATPLSTSRPKTTAALSTTNQPRPTTRITTRLLTTSQPKGIAQLTTTNQPRLTTRLSTTSRSKTTAELSITNQRRSTSRLLTTIQPKETAQLSTTSQHRSTTRLLTTSQPKVIAQLTTTNQPRLTTRLSTTSRPKTTAELSTTNQPRMTTRFVTKSQPKETAQLLTTSQPRMATRFLTTTSQPKVIAHLTTTTKFTTTRLSTTSRPKTTAELSTTNQPRTTTRFVTTIQPRETAQLSTTSQPRMTTRFLATSQPIGIAQLTATNKPRLTTRLSTTSQSKTTAELSTTNQPRSTFRFLTTTQLKENAQLSTTSQHRVTTRLLTTSQPKGIAHVTTTNQPRMTSRLSATIRPTTNIIPTATKLSTHTTRRPRTTTGISTTKNLMLTTLLSTTSRPKTTAELSTANHPRPTTRPFTTIQPKETAQLSTTSQSRMTTRFLTTSQPKGIAQLTTTNQPRLTTRLSTTSRSETTAELSTTNQPRSTSRLLTTIQPKQTAQLSTTSQHRMTTRLLTTSQPKVIAQLTTRNQPRLTTRLSTTSRSKTTGELLTTNQPRMTTRFVTTSQHKKTAQLSATSLSRTTTRLLTTSQPKRIVQIATTSQPRMTTRLLTTILPKGTVLLSTTSQPRMTAWHSKTNQLNATAQRLSTYSERNTATNMLTPNKPTVTATSSETSVTSKQGVTTAKMPTTSNPRATSRLSITSLTRTSTKYEMISNASTNKPATTKQLSTGFKPEYTSEVPSINSSTAKRSDLTTKVLGLSTFRSTSVVSLTNGSSQPEISSTTKTTTKTATSGKPSTLDKSNSTTRASYIISAFERFSTTADVSTSANRNQINGTKQSAIETITTKASNQSMNMSTEKIAIAWTITKKPVSLRLSSRRSTTKAAISVNIVKPPDKYTTSEKAMMSRNLPITSKTNPLRSSKIVMSLLRPMPMNLTANSKMNSASKITPRLSSDMITGNLPLTIKRSPMRRSSSDFARSQVTDLTVSSTASASTPRTNESFPDINSIGVAFNSWSVALTVFCATCLHPDDQHHGMINDLRLAISSSLNVNEGRITGLQLLANGDITTRFSFLVLPRTSADDPEGDVVAELFSSLMQNISSDLRQNEILQYASPPPTQVTISVVLVRYCGPEVYRVIDDFSEQCPSGILATLANPFNVRSGIIVIILGGFLLAIGSSVLVCTLKKTGKTRYEIPIATECRAEFNLISRKLVEQCDAEYAAEFPATDLAACPRDGSVAFGTNETIPDPLPWL